MSSMRLDKCLLDVASDLYRAIGTDFSLRLLSELEAGNLLSVVSASVSPSAYTNAWDYLKDATAADFLRKCPLDVPGVDRSGAAREGFFKSERKCRVSNERLFPLLHNAVQASADEYLIDFVDRARKWIRRCLGKAPSLMELEPRFGPGSTYSDKGVLSTPPDKMSAQPSVTRRCFDLVSNDWRRSAWFAALVCDGRFTDGDLESSVNFVDGNRFTTVPKTALTDRGICIEPSLNVYYQLGVGGYIRRRLKRVGIDLDHGQATHRDWARKGSVDGSLSTIDLSNASDTVSYTLIQLLLPSDWFELLAALRSPKTQVQGKWVRNEKFSSMGNGFTFELETLVFSSICFAAGAGESGDHFLVYGDDIIVPSERARDVVASLRYFGFEPNAKKTFVDGPFRESCGGDFFLGQPVRAYFVKEIPNEPQHWIKLANGLRRLVRQNLGLPVRLGYTHSAWQRCLGNLPAHIRRLQGPESLGDLVIHTDRLRPYQFWKDGIAYYRTYHPVQRSLPWKYWTSNVRLAGALYGLPSDGVPFRDNIEGYAIRRVPWTP